MLAIGGNSTISCQRLRFSINGITKYTTSENSCDVTRETKKLPKFQDREHMDLLCPAAVHHGVNTIFLYPVPISIPTFAWEGYRAW